ncbi:3-dehydroquinate dehydratase [Candidatus Endomicrobiellum trichonymphae]|jgi:3-dehydroquinate dehydratase-2|uniref:3-dehydroquinate dehydratase n=1 Tax=Endomicrobium trichonymphae TaxID=1408204 RepID=A0A1E5IJJ7_ENDTX|nr:3-dehydroquinate dehydratase [Candidatus Endomicrobium trichonymphae]
MKKILVLNGPNINMLGIREPAVYGNITLAEIEKSLSLLAKELKVEVEFFQSNHEGKIVDKIQDSVNKIFGIIINPAALTHTSIAIRDALSSISVPTIEIHISNIYARERFRHKSYIAAATIGQIAGLGIDGYLFALRKIASLA